MIPASPPPVPGAGPDALRIQSGEIPLLPTRRIGWGAGAVGRLEELLDLAGASRALLLTTAPLVEQGLLLRRVEVACGALLAGRFDDMSAHVPVSGVHAAVERFTRLGVDAIVTFGGGSVIDAGKAVAGQIVDSGGDPPAHVALPTTLSGAELSHYYGVTEDLGDGRFKRSYAREELTPTMVIFDPELTAATPERLWTSSAIKAIDHAVEGLLGNAPLPVVGSLALLGIRHLSASLHASLDPSRLDARLACQLAAWEC